MKTWLILPIYNEGANIINVISDIRKTFEVNTYHIIAVNDHSQDNSLQILKQLQQNDLTIIDHHINMNVGTVFSNAFDDAIANGHNDDIIIIMESDQTSSVKTAKKMVNEMENNEIVIASRYQEGGGYVSFPTLRYWLSFSANKVMRTLFKSISNDVYDYTIFFRAYRLSLIKKGYQMYSQHGLIRGLGFTANAEILVKLSLLTNKIKEIPYIYDYGKKRGSSKLKILITIMEYLVMINYLKRLIKQHHTVSKHEKIFI